MLIFINKLRFNNIYYKIRILLVYNYRNVFLKYYDLLFNYFGHHCYLFLKKHNYQLIDAHTSHLGHFGPQFDYIIKTKPKNVKLIFFVYKPKINKKNDHSQLSYFPNSYLYKILSDKYIFINSIIMHTICHPIMWDKFQKIRGIRFHHVAHSSLPVPGDYFYLLNKYGPSISLPKKDRNNGYSNLYEMGFKKDNWFYCIYSRDGSFKSDNNNIRNSNIITLKKAVKYLNDNGGWCIQLGSKNTKQLDIDGKNHILRYLQSSSKSDFMDIFLTSETKMFVGSTGGICDLARHVFYKPTAYHNFIPFSPWHIPALTNKTIILPKLIFALDKDRLLTFKEHFELVLLSNDPYYFTDISNYNIHNLKIIDNDSEDIYELVRETFSSLHNNIVVKHKNQNRFNSILSKYYKYKIPDFKISTHFLNKYEELLR